MPVNVFVSYSEKDHLAATLVGTLRTNPDVRIFIAHQMRSPGLSIRQKVDLAIGQAHVFLLLWSSRSQSSEWVGYEIETALRLKKRILPVLVEDVELPTAIEDIEAVPLYKESDRWMEWLSSHISQMAAGGRGSNLNWGVLAKAGVAAVVGLAAWWADSKSAEPAKADADRPAKRRPKRRT